MVSGADRAARRLSLRCLAPALHVLVAPYARDPIGWRPRGVARVQMNAYADGRQPSLRRRQGGVLRWRVHHHEDSKVPHKLDAVSEPWVSICGYGYTEELLGHVKDEAEAVTGRVCADRSGPAKSIPTSPSDEHVRDLAGVPSTSISSCVGAMCVCHVACMQGCWESTQVGGVNICGHQCCAAATGTKDAGREVATADSDGTKR